MHELSVAQRIVEIALEAAAADHGATILALRIRIGALTCIEPETLRFAIGVLCADTAARGCRVDFVRVPCRLACEACGVQSDRELLDPCPSCGATGGAIVTGRELSLESIDIDDGLDGAADPMRQPESQVGASSVPSVSVREERP